MRKIIALVMCVCFCIMTFSSCKDNIGSETEVNTPDITEVGTVTPESTPESEKTTAAPTEAPTEVPNTGTATPDDTNGSETDTSVPSTDDNDGDGSVVLDENGYPDETKLEGIKGEAITEEQWNTVIKGLYTNYTYTYFDGKTKMNVKLAGDTYDRSIFTNGILTERDGRFSVGEDTDYYIYDSTAGKWSIRDNYSHSHNYPLKDFPVEFSQFKYDQNTGAYIIKNYSMGPVKVNIELKFKDGNCVYINLSQYAEEENTQNMPYQMFVFANYESTVVISPDSDSLV